MKTWVALLRGINVGGHHRLPMKDLVRVFEDAGCEQTKTYIQSGNVVFRADATTILRLERSVGDAISAEHGFRPDVYLVSAGDLDAAVADNPYPDAAAEPTSLHLFLLDKEPEPSRIADLDDVVAASESYTVSNNRLYLHAPDGIARSKLARSADRILGVRATARNWRTIMKLSEMAKVVR